MKKVLLGLIIVLLTVSSLFAEESKIPTNIGIYVAPNLNLHSPSMVVGTGIFPSYSDFTINQNSMFWSVSGGITANLFLGNDIYLNGNLGYNGIYGLMDIENGNYKEMKSLLHYIEVSPILKFYNFIPNVYNLYLLGGVEFSIPLSTKLEVENSAGDIEESELPNHLLRPAFVAGLGYSFEIGKRTFLSTDLSFHFPFMGISNDDNFDSWNASQLRLNIALTFGIGKEEVIDTIPPFVPELKTGIKEINFYNNDGSTHPIEKIKVEEIQYQELFPLIPYIFCEIDKSAPASKYQIMSNAIATGDFNIKNLNPNALSINKSTLDIIGFRMKNNNNSRLKIIGTKDAKTESTQDIDLQRAEWAKNYIISNYNISDTRIDAIGGGMPSKPSSSRVDDGQEENRRIEIYTDSKDLLAPIIIEEEKVRMAEPGYIEFIPFAYSNEDVSDWSFEIMQGGKILRKFAGIGTPDSVLWNIFPNELAASELPVDYVFSAKSVSGVKKSSEGTIPVEYYSYARKVTKQKSDSTISKFSLIVFDFDSPEITNADRDILVNNVIPAISHKSTVKIFGYSDRIGQEQYNQKLALQRAENARQILQKAAPNAKYEVFGVGENIEIYDNDNPIGRQLSRTVQIYVITNK